VNELHQAIQNRANLTDNVKLIGIAIQNTPYEVEHFKKKYQVPFPLFPDEDKSIYIAMSKPKVPYFIGVKINQDGSNEIFYAKRGKMRQKPEEFLALMLKLSGLE
jgi:peroxiredoxin